MTNLVLNSWKTAFGSIPLLASVSLHATVLFYTASLDPAIELRASDTASTPRSSVQVQLKTIPPKVEPLIEKKISKVVPEAPSYAVEVPVEIPLEQPLELEDQVELIDDAPTEFSPAPHYPRLARLRGHEGFVRLKIGIDGMGRPVHIELLESSGHQSLDRAALEGLKKWRFSATNGTPELSYWTEKVIEFQLR